MARVSMQELDAFLDKKYKELKLPGVSVAIRGPEGVVFEKGYGVRDMEKSITPDANTIYGIASMGKSMAGLSLAILAAEGKITIDDPVYWYIPNFHIEGNADDAITIRSLLTHTAGIPPMEPLEWSIAVNTPTRDSDWALKMKETAPNAMNTIDQIVEYIGNCGYKTLGAPGEYMSYSNEGYAVACRIVEVVADMSMEQFLDERVFGPLGMTRSTLDDDASRAREIATDGNLTALFEYEDGKLVVDEDWSILPPFKACACVKSTAHDMARYYTCLANDGVLDGEQVILKEAVELMVGKEFSEQEKPVYCLGLEKRTLGEHVLCEHSGGLHGVSSEGGFLKDLGYGVTVLTNLGDGDAGDLLWALLNYLTEEPLDKKLRWLHQTGKDFSQPEMLFGKYLCHEGVPSVVEVSLNEGKLMGKRDDTEYELKHCGETWFQMEHKGNVCGRCHFLIRDGKAWGLQVYTRIFQRVEE